MPAGSPFTFLCQNLAIHQDRGRADLHIHSTHSDGAFTPEEIVQHAVRAGLLAIAVTDHDTLNGYRPTVAAAQKANATVEIIPAVEITCDYRGREIHLLAYFVRPDDPTLSSSLEKLRQGRLERFEAMAKRLREVGLSIEDKEISRGSSLGRRHLAKQLIETQQVRSTYEAFSRYLCHPDLTSIPKAKLAIDEAIATVKNAGGISSWAHPPGDVTMDQVRELQSFGLDALECEYPWSKPSHGRKLRAWAAEAGLSITGGTDCHGPQPNSRAIGSRTIRKDELAALRSRIR